MRCFALGPVTWDLAEKSHVEADWVGGFKLLVQSSASKQGQAVATHVQLIM